MGPDLGFEFARNGLTSDFIILSCHDSTLILRPSVASCSSSHRLREENEGGPLPDRLSFSTNNRSD
jgi:hypothetical protein